VGIAAVETLKLFPSPVQCGISLRLDKGLPLGSGMGSSAASAAAACWAVNSLFGCPVPKEKLILAGLQSEAAVSGYHADNIAPALLGGFVLVRYRVATADVQYSESCGITGT
jgi:homoserine kinase